MWMSWLAVDELVLAIASFRISFTAGKWLKNLDLLSLSIQYNMKNCCYQEKKLFLVRIHGIWQLSGVLILGIEALVTQKRP